MFLCWLQSSKMLFVGCSSRMVGLVQLLLKSNTASSLVEDYASCLELRSEECHIIENSGDDPGVLIMQVCIGILLLSVWLLMFSTWKFLESGLYEPAGSHTIIFMPIFCSFLLTTLADQLRMSHICYLNLTLRHPLSGQFCSQNFIIGDFMVLRYVILFCIVKSHYIIVVAWFFLCSCLKVILEILEKLSNPEVNALLYEFGFQVRCCGLPISN